MKENVLDVLMYLFENYYMDDETEAGPDRESLHVELLEAGFPHGEINKAFDWLEELARHRETTLPAPQTGRSIRLFTDRECERLDTECRGFLIFLEQMDILTPASREISSVASSSTTSSSLPRSRSLRFLPCSCRAGTAGNPPGRRRAMKRPRTTRRTGASAGRE